MSSPSDTFVGFHHAEVPNELSAVVYTPTRTAIHTHESIARPIEEETCDGGGQVVDDISEILDDDSDGGDTGEAVSVVDDPGEDISDAGDTREVVSVVKAQEAFQPGSTPMENRKRYLAYNIVGIIEVTDQSTHHIVNVEFNDKSIRAAYHFHDQFRYEFASLGQRGAVYACQPDVPRGAHVLYKPYGAWASHYEWKYELCAGTSVVGLATGSSPPTKSLRNDADIESLGDIVIATSDGELIFLSGGGMERGCMTLPGTFVTMVAGSEWVFLVTRDGSTTTDGSQNLTGRLIKFNDLCILQNDNLPVPRYHTLKWVGITEEGAPAIYDSSGAMSVMPRFRVPRAATWMRILHTGHIERGTGSSKSYWPVGVIGDTFFYLALRGHQSYPGFPRPLLQQLSIRLPFKRIDSTEALLEERVIYETLLLHILRDGIKDERSAQEASERELALDKVVIQLIRHACQSNFQARALDFARLLHGIPSLDVAIRLANASGLTSLQTAIERLKVEHGRSFGSEPSATTRPSKLTTMDGTPSTASSSQKRPADNVRLSDVDIDVKRHAIGGPAVSAMAMDKAVPTQPRGNPFSRKLPRKGSKTNSPTLRGGRTQGSLQEWITKHKEGAGR